MSGSASLQTQASPCIGAHPFGNRFLPNLTISLQPNCRIVLTVGIEPSGPPSLVLCEICQQLPDCVQVLMLWGLIRDGSKTRFATAIKLCRAVAQLVEQALLKAGAIPAPTSMAEIGEHHLAHSRAVAGAIVKASKLPPLVPEFKQQIIVAFHDSTFEANPPQWFHAATPCVMQAVPKLESSAWPCKNFVPNSN